jgi:ribosomal protein L15
LYKGKYFGKQGITSKGTKKDKRDRINLQTIEQNIKTYVKKGRAKKISNGFEIELKNYKILDSKEYMVKNKLIIKSKEASQTAIDKVKEKGGEINFTQKSANKYLPK